MVTCYATFSWSGLRGAKSQLKCSQSVPDEQDPDQTIENRNFIWTNSLNKNNKSKNEWKKIRGNMFHAKTFIYE